MNNTINNVYKIEFNEENNKNDLQILSLNSR